MVTAPRSRVRPAVAACRPVATRGSTSTPSPGVMPEAAGSPAPMPRTISPAGRSPSPSEPGFGWTLLATVRSDGRRLVHDQAVAHTPHGHDRGSVCLVHLGAQSCEVRLQPQQVRIRLGRPACPSQLQVRDDVAVRARQRFEQAEFRGCERQRRLTAAGLVPSGLEREVPGGQRPPDVEPGIPVRSTRRMTAAIRASSSALPNGFVR